MARTLGVIAIIFWTMLCSFLALASGATPESPWNVIFPWMIAFVIGIGTIVIVGRQFIKVEGNREKERMKQINERRRIEEEQRNICPKCGQKNFSAIKISNGEPWSESKTEREEIQIEYSYIVERTYEITYQEKTSYKKCNNCGTLYDSHSSTETINIEQIGEREIRNQMRWKSNLNK